MWILAIILILFVIYNIIIHHTVVKPACKKLNLSDEEYKKCKEAKAHMYKWFGLPDDYQNPN